jgi:hypothetical protein
MNPKQKQKKKKMNEKAHQQGGNPITYIIREET